MSAFIAAFKIFSFLFFLKTVTWPAFFHALHVVYFPVFAVFFFIFARLRVIVWAPHTQYGQNCFASFFMFMCRVSTKKKSLCVYPALVHCLSQKQSLCVHPSKALWKFTRKGHRRDLLDKGFSNKGFNRHNQCLVTVQNQGQGNKWTRYPKQWNKNLTGKCYLHPSAILSGIGSTRSHVCSVQCSSLFRSLRVSW